MLASVVLEHSEAVFVGSVGPVAAGYGVGSEVVYVEDSKDRVLVVTSLKTYMQTTLAPTSNKPVGYEWMVILALPPALQHSTVAEVTVAAATTRSPASRSWFAMYVSPFLILSRSRLGDFSYRGQLPTKILLSSSRPLVRSNSLRFCSRAPAPREWVSFSFPISLRRRPQSVSTCVLPRSLISPSPPHSQIPKLYVRWKTVGYVHSLAIPHRPVLTCMTYYRC